MFYKINWNLTPINHGFTLIEILVVMVVIGLLAGVALPRLYDISRRFEIASQKDQLLMDIGNIGYHAYLSGRPVQLDSLPTRAADSLGAPERVAIKLPPGWQLTTTSPIGYNFNGLCNGGSVDLHAPDGQQQHLTLTAPLCQPIETQPNQPLQP